MKNICVVGSGNMGRQIALQCAIHNYHVSCTDSSDAALEDARTFTADWIAQRVEKQKLSADDGNRIRTRLQFTKDIRDAAGNVDLVIEAASENIEVKRAIFKTLDDVCPPHTILATNSSYIVSSRIAFVTSRPDKVLNMHFFNPALVMKLVEVVRGDHVAEETVEQVMTLCRDIQKIPVRINKEIYGFVVNRIFSAITREACYLLDQQVATVEDVDTAVRNGLGHPLGPFQLLDITGIDLEYEVLMGRFRETGDLSDRPSPALVERYSRKQYGKKSGKGFYDYE